jgi:hypothetical protein
MDESFSDAGLVKPEFATHINSIKKSHFCISVGKDKIGLSANPYTVFMLNGFGE